MYHILKYDNVSFKFIQPQSQIKILFNVNNDSKLGTGRLGADDLARAILGAR